ncbi:hypothetical protein GLOIN_2v1661292 [Rhizophagus irregularis DAOM 181602=DAOM 197198]|uniref:Uncharacterized protein n=1 Tax=Rhizophagus irregularis (strain DAOM 181602 / DAOM 197198 / MUCL 43194) TaxID=747089 RepID=A0A2P4PKS8_RHIID|nr:hypothetical protein GLOIN_2v1661292 [Rhizophagus irregularis DAOM 181602=DAOM 197198]POG65996.1 hypothetical protein GLOIN_2v1661292 [Rhizophagus irregularis DAOM 181602=DAOM 197198]|eukprot:XP_025172862.1 hypothetical protein GLOIN_2v1661292 [Rhizophagus irregularis DAOM 181602=DAOM 197198]
MLFHPFLLLVMLFLFGRFWRWYRLFYILVIVFSPDRDLSSRHCSTVIMFESSTHSVSGG